MVAFNVRLNDPSLLVGQNYIDGKWVEAQSGKRFDVTGECSCSPQHVLH